MSSKTMARSKDVDSGSTYDSIVDAALEVLAECHHPSKLTLREVARKAELSKSAIHYYFGSREDLLEACLDGYYERLMLLTEECLSSAASESDGRAAIEYCARALYKFVCMERNMVFIRMSLNSEFGELHPRRNRLHGQRIGRAAMDLVRHVEVSPLELRLAIQAASSMMVRFAVMSDEELTQVSGVSGPEAKAVVEDFVVNAARRLVRPGDG